MGLGEARNRSIRPANFIRSHLSVKSIGREKTTSELAQDSSFSDSFSFRAPSETLQLRRAFSTDDRPAFPPQPEKALIGVCSAGGHPFLVAKLAWRKNLATGSILRRPCFCSLAAPEAPGLIPVRAFWPMIRNRMGRGHLLFSAANRLNFSRILKADMAKMGIPDAHR